MSSKGWSLFTLSEIGVVLATEFAWISLKVESSEVNILWKPV